MPYIAFPEEKLKYEAVEALLTKLIRRQVLLPGSDV